MKLKKAIVLSLLLLFSVGSLALGGTPGQNNNKHRMERRGNSNRGKARWKHRRRHRRHWRKHNM